MEMKLKIKMLWWLEIKEYEQRHHSAEEASKLALHAPVTGFENVKIDDLARKTRVAHEEGQGSP